MGACGNPSHSGQAVEHVSRVTALAREWTVTEGDRCPRTSPRLGCGDYHTVRAGRRVCERPERTGSRGGWTEVNLSIPSRPCRSTKPGRTKPTSRALKRLSRPCFRSKLVSSIPHPASNLRYQKSPSHRSLPGSHEPSSRL